VSSAVRPCAKIPAMSGRRVFAGRVQDEW
jgi:hypothetical protein